MSSLFCQSSLPKQTKHLHLSDECVKTSCSLVYTIALPSDFWVIPKRDKIKGKPRLGFPTGSPI